MIKKRSALTYLDTAIRQFQAYRHAASQGLAITESNDLTKTMMHRGADKII